MAEVSLVRKHSDEYIYWISVGETEDKYHWILLKISQHCFMKWLGAIRQQAITWTDVHPDSCCHMLSPGHNELSDSHQGLLAATKQLLEHFFLSVCLSVRPSVRLSHLFHYVSIILSSWNFQELLPLTDVMSMQKVKVKGQGHRGHDPI